DDDDVSRVVAGSDLIPFSTQARENPLGIHQGLGATETDESDFRCAAAGHAGYRGLGGGAPGGNKRAAMLDAPALRRHRNRGLAPPGRGSGLGVAVRGRMRSLAWDAGRWSALAHRVQ